MLELAHARARTHGIACVHPQSFGRVVRERVRERERVRVRVRERGE